MMSPKLLARQGNYSNPFSKGLLMQIGTVQILWKREKCHGKSQGIAYEMICIKRSVFSLQVLSLTRERVYQVPVPGLAETKLLARLITAVCRGVEPHLCPEPPLLEKPPLLCFSPGLSPQSRMRQRRGVPWGLFLASAKCSFTKEKGCLAEPRRPRCALPAARAGFDH